MKALKALFNKTTAFLRKEKFETIKLNNHTFKLIKGTFKEDYDNAWFYELAKTTYNLMDIGSNIGAQTVLGFAGGHLRSSLLVDANVDALAIAAKNLLQNSLVHHAHFYVGFVSDEDNTQVRFWTVGTGAAGSMYQSHAKTAHDRSSSYTVNTVTIDSLVAHFSFQPDLIKIDVEGAESKVLHGSIQTTRQFSPTYFVEMHSNEQLSMEENTSLILSWCNEYEYRAYYLKEHVMLTSPVPIKHRGRCHILLLPKDRPYPDALKLIKQGDAVA